MNLRAVGYTRASTEDQETRPVDDERRIRAACVAYDFDLVEFIAEESGVSGKIPLARRPRGRRVHELIETKRPWADVLVVTSFDRLIRDGEDGMKLIKKMVPRGRHDPIRLMSLDDHIDLTCANGRFFAKLRVLLGEFERELIGERTSNVLRYKRGAGQVYSRHLPYGWDRTDDKTLVVNEREQKVLADMKTWRAEGVKDHQIAMRLNDADVTGKRGGRWQGNTVYRILKVADEIGAGA
jgi:DNA invertase Pin-like site-specific DNA recombinase